MKLYLCTVPGYKGNILITGTQKEMRSCAYSLERLYNYYLMVSDNMRKNYSAMQVVTCQFGNNAGIVWGMDNNENKSENLKNEWKLLINTDSITEAVHKIRIYGHA